MSRCNLLAIKIITMMYTYHRALVVVALTGVSFSALILSSGSAHAAQSACPFMWQRNLSVGDIGEDVRQLQVFLNSDSDTVISSSGVGSVGMEGTSYGRLTRDAVKRFQEKYRDEVLAPAGLSGGNGRFGVYTRGKLNALCSSKAAKAPQLQSLGDFPRMVAVEQPAPTLAMRGAGGVPFTTFDVLAGPRDLELRSITLKRTGPSEDRVFDGVALSDEDGDIGDGNFNSNHELVIPTSIRLSAGAVKTFSITADISDDLDSLAGQMPSISVVSIDASESVAGLPVVGTAHTVNASIQIGGARAMISQFDPSNNTVRYIGDADIRFSGIRLTADSVEDLTLESIAWDQSGTASSGDITDVQTVVNGVAYSTEINGRTYTSTFTPALVIPKGQSVELYVQGDLTYLGAKRTVQFDIRSSDDISLIGNTYGYGVGTAPEGNTAVSGNSVFITSDGTSEGDEGAPFFAGSVASISGGAAVNIQAR